MEKEQLVSNVKEWIGIDEEMKQLQSMLREKRKRKKELTDELVNVMKQNEIECFDIKNGQLLYSVNKSKKPLTKKLLIATVQKYYQNDSDKAKELTDFILENRNETVTETIKRKST
jgi:hypothetical protein